VVQAPRVNLITQQAGSYRHLEDSARKDKTLSIICSEYPLPAKDTDLYLIEAERMEQLLDPAAPLPTGSAVPGRAGASAAGLPVIVFGPGELLPKAFGLGCSDYLRDPWDYAELQLRTLRHTLPPVLRLAGGPFLLEERRLVSFPTGEAGRDSRDIGSGASAAERGTAEGHRSEEVELSFQEALVLRILLLNRGEAVYRETLQYALWGERRRESRAVDMHITALRKKMEKLAAARGQPGGAEKTIQTVRTIGYRIV